MVGVGALMVMAAAGENAGRECLRSVDDQRIPWPGMYEGGIGRVVAREQSLFGNTS